MKKISFLIKLKKEEKISVVEPSLDICDSYINKSNNSLKSAKILFENGQYEDSVPMAYYSMYNIVMALFFNVGIKCENHSASIIILKELFGIDNSEISYAKIERIDKQYYVDFKITKEEIEKLIDTAERFNPKVFDFIDKLTIKKAAECSKEFCIAIELTEKL